MTLAIAAPKPLRGLYNARKKRKQEVRTPRKLIDAFADALGGEVPLDPCATRSAEHHFARVNWMYAGLKRAWLLPAYANPPYKYLAAWLAHTRAQALLTGLPTILLGPWRSHRTTFCAELDGQEVVYLKAFPFEGQTNTAPFACFVVAWNLRLPSLPWELGRSTMIASRACPLPISLTA